MDILHDLDDILNLPEYHKNKQPSPNGGKSVHFQQDLHLQVPDIDVLVSSPTPSPNPKSPRSNVKSGLISNSSTFGLDPDLPTLSVNDENEDWKFQSYHLDYKYTPPPIKGPCCVCDEGIMGAMVTALDKMWHPEHFVCVHCHVELRSPMYVEQDGKPYCKHCHSLLFLPPCAHCNKEITNGKYITAMNKVWHPDCFHCHRCKKPLSPTNYFTKDGKTYCEDDFHDLFSPKCFSCKKPIKDDRIVSVLGKHWHPEHFKCCKCNCILSPNNFKEKNGKLYCENDYNDLFMPKCAKCNTPILQTPANAMGKIWHPKCFNCTECKKQLNPENFLEKNGKPYCEDDFHKLFSPKCSACTKPIIKKMVTALGKNFHPEHFCCTECRKQLSPDKFFEKDGLPYCEDDFHKLFSPRCAGCNQPIKGKYVTAMGKKWHPEHFTCFQCGKQLQENGFYERDGRAYCVDDFLDLFAPKCRGCRRPIADDYCLEALGSDWHADCFRCKDCNCLLEESNFFEFEGEPYCEHHYHARMCPDCIKMRRAQNKYWGIPEDTPLRPTSWASQVSLKSLDLGMTSNGTRPISQMSNKSYDVRGGASSPQPSIHSIKSAKYADNYSSHNGHNHTHSHNHSDAYNHIMNSNSMISSNYNFIDHERSPHPSHYDRSRPQSQLSIRVENGDKYSSPTSSPSTSRQIYSSPNSEYQSAKFPVEPAKHIRFESVITKEEVTRMYH